MSEQVQSNTEEPAPEKGQFLGACNRTACQRPGATDYNLSTERYYCASCAMEINRANRVAAADLFGTPLCVPVTSPAHPRFGAASAFDYPAAARVIHLHLGEFCDERLAYPEMIAESARRAAREVALLRGILRTRDRTELE